MSAAVQNDEIRLSKALLCDVNDALQVAGLDGEPELQLAPDFAGVVADIRDVLTVPEIADATGVKERQVHHWANGSHSPKGEARDRLLVLHQVIDQLKLAMGNEQIKVWLFTPQPGIGNRPIDLMAPSNGRDVLSAARALSRRSGLDDEYLVQIAQHGHAGAYDELVQRYRGFVRLKATSYASLVSDPDDLIQEGLLGLYRATRDFSKDRKTSFRQFAELCITRQIITGVKRGAQRKHSALDLQASQLEGPLGQPSSQANLGTPESPSQLLAGEGLDQLVSRLSGVSGVLSELEGHVLSLYLDGYSYEATAEQIGCDMKTVDDALQRIKQKVGALLASGNLPDAESSG